MKPNTEQTSPRARLLLALDLMEFGIDLVRKNPNSSKEQIARELQSWINQSTLVENGKANNIEVTDKT